MALRRVYSVEFAGAGVSAAQDLVGLYCGASMAVELHGVVIGQVTGTTVQNLKLSVNRFPATVTSGSGGSSATPQKIGRGDAAPTATARTNDTTQMTTSGTKAVLHSDVFNTINGYQFFWPPEDRPNAGLNEALNLSLDSAPSSAMTMSGTLYFAELI